MDRTDEVSNHIYSKAKLTWFEEIFKEYKLYFYNLSLVFTE
ncbi:lysyl-tRNA synthetase [Streptococcus pneumoniae]|nr:lysyl-tRNA synthetase [Streptococcus pneumoniae]TNW39865.1 lysyl-tRNA synthetase [Streptococcus pneumoniae]